MDYYLFLLEYLATHPIRAIIFGIAEFAFFHWIYYKTGEKTAVRFILGLIYSPQNFVVNCTAISLIGLEIPREMTTTSRLKRWQREGGGSRLKDWRVLFATSVCRILNKSDPGHC